MKILEQAVLGANDAFYLAFSNKDMTSMQNLWSDNHDVAVIHPGWPPLLGHDAVRSSWKRILEGGMSPAISCHDAKANILGDTALVICTEMLADTELIATNVFVKEESEWKMIHHQSGPLPVLNMTSESDSLH
jgi:ketosteroid isomerase-like protein